jgi:hypothetical protein
MTDQIFAGDGHGPEDERAAVETRSLGVGPDQDPILDDDVTNKLIENSSIGM